VTQVTLDAAQLAQLTDALGNCLAWERGLLIVGCACVVLLSALLFRGGR